MAYYPAATRNSFWFDNSRPRNAPDGSYLFIGSAVDILGRAIFADWQEDTPKKAFASVARDQDAVTRIVQIMDELGPAIARGQVGFALRAAKGGNFKLPREELGVREGAYVQFSRSAWNVDDFTPFFKFGQMSDGVFRADSSGVLDWIFIERESLEKFSVSIAKHNSAVTDVVLPEISNPVVARADQIIAIKKENPMRTKEQIRKEMGVSKAAFDSAWALARENYSPLMKAGAPMKAKK